MKKYLYVTRFLLVKETISSLLVTYNGNNVEPLNFMLSKTSYDGKTKWIYFLIEDDDLLEKHNTIWDKVSTDIKK